jgi:hypothetical protein
MTVRSKHLKIVGAVGASALAVGTLGVAPALAAGKTMTFQCQAPLLATSATLTPAKLPAKMAAGQASTGKMTVVIHLTPTQTTIAGSLGQTVSGKVTAKGEKNTIAYKVSFPSKDIQSGSSEDITATGKYTVTAPKAGKYTLNAGNLTANLVIDNSGTDTPVKQSCTPPTDGTQTLGTITVSKAKTKSKVSASAKGSKATVSDKVTSNGLTATGKVSFSLKKGSKTVKASGKLNKKGVATISKSLSAGKYSITATYKGNKNVSGSVGTGSVTVK